MESQIKIIQKAMGKLQLENKENLKEFLEDKYKQELIELFNKENIQINILKNKTIRKVIFSILWSYIAKHIILKEKTESELITDFFYNDFLEKIPFWNAIESIRYWQNIVINFKDFIKDYTEKFFLEKDIKINPALIEWIAIFFSKKQEIALMYQLFSKLIIEEIWNRSKYYQKLLFFLTTYFSWGKIFIGPHQYLLPHLNLFDTDKSLQHQLSKLTSIKKQKKTLEKQLDYLSNLKESLEKDNQQFIKIKKEKKSSKELIEKNINHLLDRINKINIKLQTNKQIMEKENVLFGSIKNLALKKENKNLMIKKQNLLLKLWSLKEILKDINHQIYILELNINSTTTSINQTQNKISQLNTELENLTKTLTNIEQVLEDGLKTPPLRLKQ